MFDTRNFNNNNFPPIAEGHNIVGYISMMVRDKLREEYPQEYEAVESQSQKSKNISDDINRIVQGLGNI